MQENDKKKSIFFERLLQIFDYYGIKNVKSFACDYLGYKSPEKINRLKDINNKPSYDILCDISNKFEFIDLQWLITGQGSMLRAEPSQVSPTPPVQETSGEVAAYYRMYKEKDAKVEELLKENARLEERLRLYESEHPDLKKDVKDVSTGSHLYQDNPPATSAGAHLKGSQRP